MKAARVDGNQKEIVAALRKAGATVLHLHTVGHGCPDIAVGWMGRTYLLEIKAERGKLSPDEIKFFAEWTGHAVVVRSAAEALEVLSEKEEQSCGSGAAAAGNGIHGVVGVERGSGTAPGNNCSVGGNLHLPAE